MYAIYALLVKLILCTAAVCNEGTRTVLGIPNVLTLVPDEAVASDSNLWEIEFRAAFNPIEEWSIVKLHINPTIGN